MDIYFNCNVCGQRLVVEQTGMDYTVQCPNCENGVSVPKTQDPASTVSPAPGNTVSFICKRCHQPISAAISQVGKLTSCPKCEGFVTVPTVLARPHSVMIQKKPAVEKRPDKPKPPATGLVACKSCGKDVAKHAPTCPSCGEAAPGLHVKCPKCGSIHFRMTEKGFDTKRGAVGVLLFGIEGTMLGMTGNKQTLAVCQNCGKEWIPKQGF